MTLLESSSSNSGSNWQLFSFGAVAHKRVETRMHEHSRGQASAELGEKTPNRDTVQHFSRRPRQWPWPAIKMIREEWCFGSERPQNKNNIYGLKPFPQNFDNNNFCTNRNQSYQRGTPLINRLHDLIIRMNSHR